ncbi:MAG: RIP metalloprotease RseP [Nevskia sp.]|nr:RIP metalloprotease RseP [Nevskia sp.]
MLEILRNLFSYILAIGVLVSFHEFGHFWMARRFGVKVLRFSVGFGNPIWRRRGRDGVEYLLGSIPLGGYVKLLDEREGPVAPADLPRAFNRKPVAARIAVFAAGPAFNFLLAVVCYWAMYVIGIPGVKPLLAEPPGGSAAAVAGLHEGDLVTALDDRAVQTWSDLRTRLVKATLGGEPLRLEVRDRAGKLRAVALDSARVSVDPQRLFDDLGLSMYQPPIPPVLGEILPGHPAEQAGFKPGDRLVAAGGAPIASFQEFQRVVSAHPGEVLKVTVERAGARLDLSVIPVRVREDGVGYVRIGARPAAMADNAALWHDLQAQQRFGAAAAVPEALRQTWDMSTVVAEFLYRMLLGEISIKNISGPINTAETAGYAVSIGLSAFLGFIAFVSLNLGIFNLLPIPVLDGGQIFYGLVEAAKGSPLSERAQALGQQVGVVLLVLLMGLAFYNDLARHVG